MAPITFEQSLELREIATDVFENGVLPWTWPRTRNVPGPQLMALTVAAASRTRPHNFNVDSLLVNFLNAPSPDEHMHFKVARLSNGRRFAVRSVLVEQKGLTVLQANVTFVNIEAWTGPQMSYARSRQTTGTVEAIDKDVLLPKTDKGPFIKIQQLPATFKDSARSPQLGVSSFAAQMTPIDAAAGALSQHLGIVSLSDVWAISAPLQLSGLTWGLPDPADSAQKPTENNMKVGTSLNHSVHFHLHDDFRADDLKYIEVTTPWAKDGRAMLNSSIFDRDGRLIATVEQESFYVLKNAPPSRSGSKL